jgi:BirA family biotin operon repressor/biotin-[acetyl-CoA-carboxylase] ligase
MDFLLGPRARVSGHRVESFEQVGSTSAEALARARTGECGPLWFVTDNQTEGRGRRQRPWIATRDNLAASYLDVMDVPPATAATLGFVAGVALDAALGALCALRPETAGKRGLFRLKWPNDVLAGEAKLAGILLEAESIGPNALAVAVGIGVNVATAPKDLPYPAAALADLGLPLTTRDVFTALSDAWAEHLRIWDCGRGFAEIRALWLARAVGVGAPVVARLGSRTVSGIFDMIDAQGRLIVRLADGSREAISAGDVQFGDGATAREGT